MRLVMGKARLTTEDVQKEIWNLVGDEYAMLGEYIDSKTPFMIRHNKCGREYYVRWNNFKHGKRCAACRGVLKYTIEEARKAFNDLGLTLLAEEYVHALYPMDYICRAHPEEGVLKGTLSAILGHHISCKKCRYTKTAVSQKKSYEEVAKLFDEHGLDLIDSEYVNANTHMNYICRKHPELGVQQTTFDSISHNKYHGCPRCGYEAMGNNKRMPDEDIVMLFDEYDFDVIDIIKERRTKVKCICRKHRDKGIQIKTLNGIKHGKGCKYCANVVPLTQEEVTRRVYDKNPNIDVVSDYINGDSPLTLKCKICNCRWTLSRAESAISPTRGKCSCPHCDGSIGARKIFEFLTQHKFNFDTEYSFPDLFGYSDKLLRFDFAIFDKDGKGKPTLIEFDGQHHYFPVDYCGEGSDEALRRHNNCVKYDKKKNTYCKTHDLKLIRIPYWEVNNIENILIAELLEEV